MKFLNGNRNTEYRKTRIEFCYTLVGIVRPEIWKGDPNPWLDQRAFAGTILMDLSKAYSCIPHDLLIAKLECYGIHKTGLPLILDYLFRSRQRAKIGCAYSSCMI